MKNAVALFATGTLVALLAPAGRADDPPPESVYFEARIFDDAEKPQTTLDLHALVKVGADAELSAPSKDGRFTLEYTVRPGADGTFLVIATGLRDGRIVTAGAMTIAHDGRTIRDLQGGGFTWRITGERATPELQNRHKR